MRTEAVKRRPCPASSSGEMRAPATVAPSHAAPDNEQLHTGVRCTEREHRAVDEGQRVRTLGPRWHDRAFREECWKAVDPWAWDCLALPSSHPAPMRSQRGEPCVGTHESFSILAPSPRSGSAGSGTLRLRRVWVSACSHRAAGRPEENWMIAADRASPMTPSGTAGSPSDSPAFGHAMRPSTRFIHDP
jgi:hypothetical protein